MSFSSDITSIETSLGEITGVETVVSGIDPIETILRNYSQDDLPLIYINVPDSDLQLSPGEVVEYSGSLEVFVCWLEWTLGSSHNDAEIWISRLVQNFPFEPGDSRLDLRGDNWELFLTSFPLYGLRCKFTLINSTIRSSF
jgi:hypothetical protein